MPPTRLDFPKEAVLEFITDVEGNWEYFCRLVERSTILSWRADDATLLVLATAGYLIFGGDAPDKGPGDIRVTRALVMLQKEHPDRVFLLAGNRDVNKLRFAAELASGQMPDVDPVPYLDKVSWQGVKQPFPEFLQERGLPRTPMNGLRWILEKTMGTATLLETRRAELVALGHPHSDGHVLRSFANLVEPSASKPWTLQYLRVALVMLVIGDCLFIHGAIRSRGLLLVPAEDGRDGSADRQPPPLRLPQCTRIEDWASELNSWKARQVRLFEAFPHFVKLGEERWRGGQPLMMPSLAGCHVMTDGFLMDGNGAELDADVAEYLRENGIRRVFAGHQPQGQSPGVMRSPQAGIVVLVADTSFSDVDADKSTNPADNRGAAVSTVTVRWDTTSVAGVLADGTEHGFTLHSNWGLDEGDGSGLVGRQLQDGSWGRTIVEGKLQTCKGEGFRLSHRLVDTGTAWSEVNDCPRLGVSRAVEDA